MLVNLGWLLVIRISSSDDTERNRGEYKMRHRTLCAFFLFVFIMGIVWWLMVWINPVERQDFGFEGKGTKRCPYQIGSVEDLILFRDLINSGETSFQGVYLHQTTDLDLKGIGEWTPIGDFQPGLLRNYFRGHYDGAGHIIENITVSNVEYGGLFSILGGEVRNLGIESGYINGSCVGSIASHGTADAAIINCYNKAEIYGIYRAGGIADNLGGGKIEYCWNLGEVSADSGVNYGISSYSAVIANCYCKDIAPAPVPECVVEDTILFTLDELRKVCGKQEIYENIESDLVPINVGDQTVSFVPKEGCSKFTTGLKTYCLLFVMVVFSVGLWIRTYTFTKENKFAENSEIQKKPSDFCIEKSVVKKGFCNVGLFLLIFLLGTTLLNETLMQKKDEYTGPFLIKSYYKQPQETIDVLLMGNSGVGVNLSCEELWKDYGLSSYALWGYAAPFWNSYYYLKEAVKVNKPKILVLEVATVASTYEYQDEVPQYSNTIGIRNLINRIQAVQVSAPQDRWGDLVFGFPVYHTRFSELTRDDFSYYFWNTDLENEKGEATLQYLSSHLSLDDVSKITEVRHINQKQEKYLRKMIEYCQEENIQVILVKTPLPNRVPNQPYYNAVSEIANEYEIPFINFNLLDKECGLEEDDFYADNHHLNKNGARKVSSYLGKYIMSNYTILDHRGDENYRSWDIFASNKQNEYLRLITEADDYFTELARDGKTAIIMKRGNLMNSEEYDTFLLKTATTGFDLSFLEEEGDVCYLVNPSSRQKYDCTQNCSLSIGNMNVSIDFVHSGAVSIGGNEVYSLPRSGVVCMVYDSISKEIVDTTVFSEDMQYIAVHQ